MSTEPTLTYTVHIQLYWDGTCIPQIEGCDDTEECRAGAAMVLRHVADLLVCEHMKAIPHHLFN